MSIKNKFQFNWSKFWSLSFIYTFLILGLIGFTIFGFFHIIFISPFIYLKEIMKKEEKRIEKVDDKSKQVKVKEYYEEKER